MDKAAVTAVTFVFVMMFGTPLALGLAAWLSGRRKG